MTKKLLIAATLASTVLFSGCATILSGSTQKVSVTSSPSNLEVTLNGTKTTTPSILTVDRGEDLILKSSKCDGQTIVAKKINPVFFVDLFMPGNIFSSTTDYSTGAMWKYDENVRLECTD